MVYLDLEKAMNDGIEFFISENEVILVRTRRFSVPMTFFLCSAMFFFNFQFNSVFNLPLADGRHQRSPSAEVLQKVSRIEQFHEAEVVFFLTPRQSAEGRQPKGRQTTGIRSRR